MPAAPLPPDLRRALALVGLDQLAAVADGVAQGRVVEIRPTPDQRPAWLLDSGPPDLPNTYKLWEVGRDAVTRGSRADLRAELLRRLIQALAPYDGHSDVPPWVRLCRLAQVDLLAVMEP
ncbi:MAG: hypothetical protein GXP62_14475 [Oligoflexia bacterium]|nr:hypothetical protein [Oligoflexia bacterium]